MSCVYVYEDPCIGAVVEAVAKIDFAFAGKKFRSVIKQTAGRRLRSLGDFGVGVLKGGFLIAEFKAPVLRYEKGRYVWCYRVRNVGSFSRDVRGALYALADWGGYYLAFIHLFADVGSASKLAGKALSHATYVHAPLTTVFIPLNRRYIGNILTTQGGTYIEIEAECRARGRLNPWDLNRFPRISTIINSYDYAIPGRWCSEGDRIVTITVKNSGLSNHIVTVKGYSLALLLKCLERGYVGVKPWEIMQLHDRIAALARTYGENLEWRNLIVLTSSLAVMDLRTLYLHMQALSDQG